MVNLNQTNKAFGCLRRPNNKVVTVAQYKHSIAGNLEKRPVKPMIVRGSISDGAGVISVRKEDLRTHHGFRNIGSR